MRSARSPRDLTVLVLVSALAVLLVGCGGNRPGTGAGSGPGSGPAAPSGSGGYAVTVHRGSDLLATLPPERLQSLPQAEVATPASAGDTTQRGPRLVDVLAAAGVAPGVRSVRVVGPSESLTLAGTEVTPDLLLSATRRGTVKLAGASLDPSRWVRDVTDVEITP